MTVKFCEDAPVAREFPPEGRRMRADRDGLRYVADHVLIDSFGLDRVEVRARPDVPGDGWTGALPAAMFSTVAGAMMAWRGAVPIHGSAVEIDGAAVLICGPAGAGKSSLTAALIATGAKLISDDLSVLHAVNGSDVPVLYAGRRTVRLFPGVADAMQQLLGVVGEYALDHHSGKAKAAVVVPHVDVLRAIPLGTLLVLADRAAPTEKAEREKALQAQKFRPAIFSQIPGQMLRAATLRAAAGAIRIATLPPLRADGTEGLRQASRVAMERLRSAG